MRGIFRLLRRLVYLSPVGHSALAMPQPSHTPAPSSCSRPSPGQATSLALLGALRAVRLQRPPRPIVAAPAAQQSAQRFNEHFFRAGATYDLIWRVHTWLSGYDLRDLPLAHMVARSGSVMIQVFA